MDSDLSASSSSPDQAAASRDSLARTIQSKLASLGPKATAAFYQETPDDQVSDVLIGAVFHVVRRFSREALRSRQRSRLNELIH